LADTSTIWASPLAFRWVRLDIGLTTINTLNSCSLCQSLTGIDML
jgi:hypothetical protein